MPARAGGRGLSGLLAVRIRKRRTRRRRTARAAAPLLIPLALALTLGVILAVSAGSPVSHVTQESKTSSSHP